MHTPKKTLIASASIAAAALLCLGAVTSAQAATILIQSRDAAGIGFNDTTPVAPVGGNPGTTLGQQRLNVYRYVADIWEAALTSNVTITVSAGWEALTCTASSAVLGSAGAWNIWHDFPGAPKAGTWYPQALANKLAGQDLATFFGQEDDGTGYGNFDIKTQFNINLGQPDCLAGQGFYLGLDGNAGGQVNFVATLLHELGHGLGFSVLSVQTSTGRRISADGSAYTTTGLPSVWEEFMYDGTAGKSWLNMTSAERQASAINPLKLGWSGANAFAGVPLVLGQGTTPQLQISGSGASLAAGIKPVGPADFGPPLSTTPVSGPLAKFVDTTDASGNALACDPLSPANAAIVAGKIALIDRGVCAFVQKAQNVQAAGAIGVLIADNVEGPISGLGGSGNVAIPAVRILKSDGNALKAALLNRRRGQPAPMITATLVAPLSGTYAGADASGRPLLYTPSTLAPGSSVSHWDTSASPNLLMEPNITADLTTVLTVPKDLTVPLLKDLGW